MDRKERLVRICFSVIGVILAGFGVSFLKLAALPEMVGIGTTIIAFCMGPLVDLMMTRLVRPAYEKMISSPSI